MSLPKSIGYWCRYVSREAKSDPTPALPCKQGREHFEASWNHPQGEAARALLLPLLAGGGWEGVKLLISMRKEQPHPTPRLRAGEGAEQAATPTLHIPHRRMLVIFPAGNCA